MSANVNAKSSNSIPGLAFQNHISLAASIADPPPIAITAPALEASSDESPLCTDASVGFGSTSVNTVNEIPKSFRYFDNLSPYSPQIMSSETINAFLTPSSTRSLRASPVDPSLKYVFGTLSHCVFSLLITTLFKFISKSGPTCPA